MGLRIINRHLFFFLFLIVAFTGLTLKSSATSDETALTWFDETKQPQLEKSWTIPEKQYKDSVKQGFSPPCSNTTLMINTFMSGKFPIRQRTEGCWFESKIGLLKQSDNFLAGERNIAGRITNIGDSGAGSVLETTPRSDTFLERYKNRSGSKKYLKLHIGTTVETSFSFIYSATHTLSSTKQITLVNETGKNILLEPGSLNYSRNGRYLLGVTDYGLFRLDIETGKYLNFGHPIKKGPGWNPYMKISITNDGKHAVATGTSTVGGQWMRLYDLGSCSNDEQPLLAIASAGCSYRDLTAFLAQNIPEFYRFTMAEFIDENTLIFYHYTDYATSEASTYTRYVIHAPNAELRAKDYIALGDSFASGEGAYDYFKGTDEGKDLNNCHLSKKAYPYIIGKWLRLNAYHSVACSGAVTRNIKGPGPLVDALNIKNRGNQYLKDIENNELSDWLPGYYLQESFIDNVEPDVATISIGGNDLGFSDKIKRCLEPDTCYSTFEDRLELLREARNSFNTLVDTYTELKNASPSTRIYVTGYPEIGNPGGDCAANVRLNSKELEFAQTYVGQLNEIIKLAAEHVGLAYVDISNSLQGSRFCEGDGKEIAINGISLGNDIAMVLGNESYHPNAYGHELLARAIIDKTNDFSLSMPAPDTNIKPSASEDSLVFLNMPRSGRQIHTVNYDGDIANNIVYRENEWNVVRNSLTLPFRPSSIVDIVLNSVPVDLGTFQSDEYGNLLAEVTIPHDTPTGFHTLHLYGQGIDGELIDIYKVVYVAHTESDKNGDGINDLEQPCGAFYSSGMDEDGDNTDDACDSIIASQIASDEMEVLELLDEGKAREVMDIVETDSKRPDSRIAVINNRRSRKNLLTSQNRVLSEVSEIGNNHSGSPLFSNLGPESDKVSQRGVAGKTLAINNTALSFYSNIHKSWLIATGFVAILLGALFFYLRYAKRTKI